ncbi:MAG: hypothetical protein IMF05_13745 [Proteobacteria bacterium]|nr:hypothetical protein [Pseudomonadota bacterium]
MNPEFRRNLLLELTLHRLVAMPLILLLLYGAAGLIDYGDTVSGIACFVILILLVAWGSRLAADAVLGEVAGRTWDSQRMSALGPWSMSWGKLAGSTIYVWYGAALSIPAALYGGNADLFELLRLLLVGLFAQVLALFASLVIQRLRPERLRFHVTQAQIVGLVGALILWNLLKWDYTDVVYWYGFASSNVEFSFSSALAFAAWCCFGIYSLMRAELQFRCWPVGWTAFTLFCAVYIAGFVPGRYVGDVVEVPGGGVILRLLMAHIVIAGLTWLGAFAEPKGFVRLRRWRDTIRTGSPREILSVMPSWSPGLLMALVTGALIMVTALLSDGRYHYAADKYLSAGLSSAGVFSAALLLFLLRDIGIIHFLTMDGRAKRALLSALVYFAALYALLPTILFALDLEDVIPALVPSPMGHPVVVIVPALLQVCLVAGLIGWRWAKLARAMQST